MKKILKKLKRIADRSLISEKCTLESRKGEGYVDTGIKALIAVVLGALILSGLYIFLYEDFDCTVFGEISSMFFYKG